MIHYIVVEETHEEALRFYKDVSEGVNEGFNLMDNVQEKHKSILREWLVRYEG